MESYLLKEHPELSAVIRAAFPAYRKTKAYLSMFSGNGIDINSYWDGGSRHEYAIVDLATLQRKSLPTRTHPYFDIARQGLANAENADITVDDKGNVTLKRLPDGFALVQAGTFCGKPATAFVYVPFSNMPKFLPAN